MKKRQFQKDFQHQMQLCEQNYCYMKLLLAGFDERSDCMFRLSQECSKKGEQECVRFTLIEKNRYTLTYRVVYDAGKKSSYLPEVALIVRVYEDAQMAEVLKDISYRQLEGHYPYPNVDMLQQDEKLQRNVFLAQCLKRCLEYVHLVATH